MTVAALYVDVENGLYAAMPDVDCWGIERDARLYDGPHPVVSHPPCQGWGGLRMSRLSVWRRNGWRSGEIDADASQMSCGPIAVDQVRRFGGVLEHPASSMLWRYCNMPEPGLLRDRYGGRTYSVDQGRYGHPCPKRTWIYVVGADADGDFDERPSGASGRVEQQWSSKRHITPQPFADLLVSIASRCAVPSSDPEPAPGVESFDERGAFIGGTGYGGERR